jgi:hypothetical protein
MDNSKFAKAGLFFLIVLFLIQANILLWLVISILRRRYFN